MAGIGFELKRLFGKRTVTDYFRAYCYTTVVTVGPFVLVASMVMTIQKLMAFFDIPFFTGQFYLASTVYSFIFSQLVSSGFTMVITRYLADLLYMRKYEEVLPSLFGILAVSLLLGAMPAGWFLARAPLPAELKLATFVLYMLMIVVWLQGVYLSAIKDYMRIVKAYAWGAAAAVVLAVLALAFPVVSYELGALAAMDIGVFIIAALLMVSIIRVFQTPSGRHFAFLAYFERYYSLFLASAAYTGGLYVHNFLVWTGPLGMTIAGTYAVAPIYDTATFYAFISVIPSTVFFIVSTETAFYEKYAAYFAAITEKGTYKQIGDARTAMQDVLWAEIRNIMEFQLVFTLLFIGVGNYLLPKVGFSFSALNIYNLLLIGAFASGMLQSIIIMLLYLEDRRGSLSVAGLFLTLNALFSYACLLLGESYYGFGFFLAAFICLCLALARLAYFSKRIDYFVYCRNPIFNNIAPGPLARLAQRLYPER